MPPRAISHDFVRGSDGDHHGQPAAGADGDRHLDAPRRGSAERGHGGEDDGRRGEGGQGSARQGEDDQNRGGGPPDASSHQDPGQPGDDGDAEEDEADGVVDTVLVVADFREGARGEQRQAGDGDGVGQARLGNREGIGVREWIVLRAHCVHDGPWRGGRRLVQRW